VSRSMSTSHDQQRRSAAWDVSAGPRNYVTLVVTQAASSLSALVTIWLLTQLLGASGYGQVAAIVAAAMLVGTAALGWSAMALARIGCEEFVKTGRITETFWTRTFILLLNWGLIALTAPLWLPAVSAWLRLTGEAQVLLFVYLGAVSWWGNIQYALQGVKLQSLLGRLLAAERLLILMGAAALVWGGISLRKVIAIYVVGAIASSVYGLWRLRHLIGRPARPGGQLVRRMLLFSLPLIPQSLVSYFSTNYLDAWFILRYMSAADLGVYSIAYQLAGTAMQLPVLVSSLLLPMFTTLEMQQGEERLETYMRELLPALSLGWAMAGALLTGLAVLVLPSLFGPQFGASAHLMWPLMAACVIAGPMSMGYGPLLNAKSATMAIAIGALAGAIVNVLLNFALIPRWGLLGCAWATAIAYLVNLLVGACLLWRRHGLSGAWTIEAVLPPLAGAAFIVITGNELAGFLLTVALTFCHALIHRTVLLNAGRRFYRLWGHKFDLPAGGKAAQSQI
jgi:O-antigen/teichoic acid export membrane protein